MRNRTSDKRATVPGAHPLQLPLWSARDASPGWNVRISRRARRLSMRVFPGGRVEVVVPPGVGIPVVERFVTRHRDWAERRAGELSLQSPQAAQRQPPEVTLASSGQSSSVAYEHGSRSAFVEYQ